ncbi:MAG: VCBS repeat-containing protein [Pseudomonadota bacterium]
MRCWLPLLLSLAPACQEYKLHPGGESEDSGGEPTTEDPGPAGVLPPPDLPHDTGTIPCVLEPQPAAPYLGTPTCTVLQRVTWDVVLERVLELPPTDLTTMFGLPVVAPTEDGRAQVFAPVASTEGDGWLAGFDGATGSLDFIVEGVENDVDGLTAFRGSAPAARTLLVAVPNDGYFGGGYTIVAPSTGATVRIPPPSWAWGPAARDLWHDGSPEVISSDAVFDTNGVLTASFGGTRFTMAPSVADWDGDNDEEIFNAAAAWNIDPVFDTPWDGLADTGITFRYFMGGLAWDGSAVRFVGQDGASAFAADRDGQVLWAEPPFDGDATATSDEPMAFGDMDGDGLPELCGMVGEETVARRLDGSVLWARTTVDDTIWTSGGGCTLADLDADGRYEALVWGILGLSILDGATGDLLARWNDGHTDFMQMGAAVADIDGDGSAEIVVAGTERMETWLSNRHIYILGPATGRWARTRPVWNQLPYDVTAVRDDGTIPAFPFPNYETYNSWRAQPAHDGDHPDLEIEVVETCRDDEHAVMAVQAVVHNRGSQDAPAGATVRLFTWDEAVGGPLTEVASQALDEPIPSMTTSAGVIFRVTTEEWATRQVLQVDGAHDDECDRVNDRVDVWEE